VNDFFDDPVSDWSEDGGLRSENGIGGEELEIGFADGGQANGFGNDGLPWDLMRLADDDHLHDEFPTLHLHGFSLARENGNC
jgi:hypothetical protein